MRTHLFPLALLVTLADVGAVDTQATEVVTTGRSATSKATVATPKTELDHADVLEARYWGVSVAELHRARTLMRGPRGAFSDPRISPVEVLGVHARSEAERAHYAEIFARLLHDDAERVLAWQRAGTEAMRRLYPDDKVVDFRATRPLANKTKGLPNWLFTPVGGTE